MKSLVWHGKEDVRVDTVPDPTIVDPTDAIIRTNSTAICGSDLHLDGGVPRRRRRWRWRCPPLRDGGRHGEPATAPRWSSPRPRRASAALDRRRPEVEARSRASPARGRRRPPSLGREQRAPARDALALLDPIPFPVGPLPRCTARPIFFLVISERFYGPTTVLGDGRATGRSDRVGDGQWRS